MTTRDEWLALAARCEAAKGADREIDEAILIAVQPFMGALIPHFIAEQRGDCVPRLTTSIDAITALIERELIGWQWIVGHAGDVWPGQFSGWLMPPESTDELDIKSICSTPALALCAAFCRAMHEKGARS